MAHECVQTGRLFRIERDATNETAERTEDMGHIRENLESISKEIASLGSNAAHDIAGLRKDVAVLTKMVKTLLSRS